MMSTTRAGGSVEMNELTLGLPVHATVTRTLPSSLSTATSVTLTGSCASSTEQRQTTARNGIAVFLVILSLPQQQGERPSALLQCYVITLDLDDLLAADLVANLQDLVVDQRVRAFAAERDCLKF